MRVFYISFAWNLRPYIVEGLVKLFLFLTHHLAKLLVFTLWTITNEKIGEEEEGMRVGVGQEEKRIRTHEKKTLGEGGKRKVFTAENGVDFTTRGER